MAVLAAVGVVIATNGGGDDETAPVLSTSTQSERASGAVKGESAEGDDRNGGGRQEGGGSPEDGSQGDSSGEPAPEQTDSSGDFASQLRSIVGASLSELAPLAQGTAAASAPDQYADMLATGASQIDDTIGELEDLDPPADAEEGTRQIIDAYRGLGDAVSRGAKDFSSGNRGRIAGALKYLGAAASAFRSGLATATQTLAQAGYSSGIR